MEALKKYLISNFEGVFILVILLVVSVIVWFVEAKLSFLNFFYLPVLLSSYYLGIRSGALGAFFTFLIIAIFASLYPERFMGPQDLFGLWALLTSWGGFLILTAWVVGYTHRKLQEKMSESLRARAEASGNAELLEQTMATIREFESELDYKVEERTRDLKEQTRSISEDKEKVEEALYSTMDPMVAKLMIDNRIRTENRRLSVMFSDLNGFTRFCEGQAPEDILAILNRYLADMEILLTQYNGHIDKYMGDGIMSEFGAPLRAEKHATLAVACGLKMQQQMRKHDFPFDLRVGIATGVATTGIIGTKRQSFTAFGDTVKLAARIENLCAPGKITVDEATYEELRELFEFLPVSGLSSYTQTENPTLVKEINSLLQSIDEQPNNVKQRIQIAQLLMQANDPELAQVHLKKALESDPGNADAKLAYGESSLLREKRSEQVSPSSRRALAHLYEVIGLKNVVTGARQLPESIKHGVIDELDKQVAYPEDLILPVECLDNSIGFSRLTGLVAYLIAERLELAEQDKLIILEAAYLSEIGKSAVPDSVLNRNGALTDDELLQIHQHPREGVRKLRAAGFANEQVLEIIECHHENFNGSGYPAGIKSDTIPLGARIVAVAEQYISLTSKRPYRDACSAPEALAEIHKLTSTGRFDPIVTGQLALLVGELADRE